MALKDPERRPANSIWRGFFSDFMFLAALLLSSPVEFTLSNNEGSLTFTYGNSVQHYANVNIVLDSSPFEKKLKQIGRQKTIEKYTELNKPVHLCGKKMMLYK